MIPFDDEVFYKVAYSLEADVHEWEECKIRVSVRNTQLTIIDIGCQWNGISVLLLRVVWERIEFIERESKFQKRYKINIIVNNPDSNNVYIRFVCKNLVEKLMEKSTQIVSSETTVNLLGCSFSVIIW